jgi:hypothetical protein
MRRAALKELKDPDQTERGNSRGESNNLADLPRTGATLRGHGIPFRSARDRRGPRVRRRGKFR